MATWFTPLVQRAPNDLGADGAVYCLVGYEEGQTGAISGAFRIRREDRNAHREQRKSEAGRGDSYNSHR